MIKKIPVTSMGIKPAIYLFVAKSVNRLHHSIPPSEITGHVITLIQFTSTHTSSNLIPLSLVHKTLMQELKQKRQHKTSHITGSTLHQTLYCQYWLDILLPISIYCYYSYHAAVTSHSISSLWHHKYTSCKS
jgi:hypothetical protein